MFLLYKQLLTATQIVSDVSIDDPMYQEIIDAARELAQATFAMLSVYEDNSVEFRTVAVSGCSEDVSRVVSLLGFDLVGKRWYHDGYRDAKVNIALRAEFEDLVEFAGHTLPNGLACVITEQFRTGRVLVFGLRQGTRLLGDMTLIMPGGKELENPDVIEVFAQMVGCVLGHINAAQGLVQGEQQLRAIFDQAGVGVCLLTLDSRYLKVNRRFCEMVGYSEEELMSLRCRDISDPEGLKRDIALGKKALLQNLLRTGKPYIRTKPYVHKKGHLVWVESSTALLRGMEGMPDRLIRVSQDVTKRYEAEARLERQLLFARLVAQISAAFINATPDSLDEKINNMLKESARFFDAGRSYVLHLSADRRLLHVTHRWCSELGHLHSEQQMQHIPFILDHWCEMIHREGYLLLDANSKPLFCVPLTIGGEVVGFFAFETESQKVWCEEQVSLLRVLANLLSDAMSRNRMELALRRAKEKAEGDSVAKTRFLANTSHEIRTPLNGMMGFFQLLERSDLDETQKGYIEIIRSSADALLSVISSVLEMARTESGKSTVDRQEFNLHSTVENALTPFIARAKEKGLCINYLLNPCVPEIVRGDANKLRQILMNLINNAVKFTHQGEVFVECALTGQTEYCCEVSFRVRDTGVGIPGWALDSIFTPFAQVDHGANQGTGLGLAICQSLAELMGGRIIVESQPGLGSTFTLTLSLERATEQKIDSLVAVQSLKGSNILAIEANATQLRVLRCYLNGLGCQLEDARSVEEGLAKLTANSGDKCPYSAILVDTAVSDSAAEQLLNTMAALPDALHLPVCVITPLTEKRPLNTTYVHPVPIISRPYRPKALFETLRDML